MSLQTELQQAVKNTVLYCFHFSRFCWDIGWEHWNRYKQQLSTKHSEIRGGFTIIRASYTANLERNLIIYLNEINFVATCDCRIVTHSVSSSFSLIPDRLVMRLRMKMVMPIQMWRGFRRALKAKGDQGNKNAQRPTNHYSIRGERHRRRCQTSFYWHFMEWNILMELYRAWSSDNTVTCQSSGYSPCGIPAKWIGPLWRSQSSCVMNTDEGCCWHCENQMQHTRLPQTTARPRTTALHGLT